MVSIASTMFQYDGFDERNVNKFSGTFAAMRNFCAFTFINPI